MQGCWQSLFVSVFLLLERVLSVNVDLIEDGLRLFVERFPSLGVEHCEMNSQDFDLLD